MPDRKPKISDRHKQLLRRALLGIIVIAVIGILIFGVRAANSSRAWHNAPPEDIAGWMTPRYVVLSQHVPRHVIEGVIALDGDVARHKITLEDIALNQGLDTAQLIARLEAAIQDFKDSQGD
ncbi:hypothetical protein DS901_16120 [Loktanella sp. D2R18]|uniref:hypothetical protein n=1 Tax=Rhodobacterales TaxID=204455 RepID=UPI000DE88801|nr:MULTISPECIES: hypothetical protein [Rhodobacterales]MDO6591011.1 hypothetical protein [Yoonia sp. 1_MG-2023]RBW42231.1 hypothetical protein DS901_16120 [Loktanella sp. D2R18]